MAALRTMPNAEPIAQLRRFEIQKHIDPHVHFRDGSQKKIYTIRQGMELAASQGVVAVGDMPNTNPPITTGDLVEGRLALAGEQGVEHGYYVWIGATNDMGQVAEAAQVAVEHPKVLGMKAYMGRSVGDLMLIEHEEQQAFFVTLANIGYKGVVIMHCEDEGLFRPELFHPINPSTWNKARPPRAEIESVRTQIAYARQAGFEGHMHIAHISVPAAVVLVAEAKAAGMRISCGVTPHHLTISNDRLRTFRELKYKVNPPIRDRGMVMQMRQLLREGLIDFIETDHAPHPDERKTYQGIDTPPDYYASGIPSLRYYINLLENLRSTGFTEEQIRDLTYSNIKRILPKIIE